MMFHLYITHLHLYTSLLGGARVAFFIFHSSFFIPFPSPWRNQRGSFFILHSSFFTLYCVADDDKAFLAPRSGKDEGVTAIAQLQLLTQSVGRKGEITH